MAKIQLKSDNINPFVRLFSILNIFNHGGLRFVIDSHLGQRCMTKTAFIHGDMFASMFGRYLCDCIKDVMEIESFWDNTTISASVHLMLSSGLCCTSPRTASHMRAVRSSLTTSMWTRR